MATRTDGALISQMVVLQDVEEVHDTATALSVATTSLLELLTDVAHWGLVRQKLYSPASDSQSYRMDYRTKPISVEAWPWSPSAQDYDLPYWLGGALDLTDNRLHGKAKRVGERLQVSTANGTVMADPGDYIVYFRITTHELQVHKPDDFRRLFDKDERRARLRSTTEKPRIR